MLVCGPTSDQPGLKELTLFLPLKFVWVRDSTRGTDIVRFWREIIALRRALHNVRYLEQHGSVTTDSDGCTENHTGSSRRCQRGAIQLGNICCNSKWDFQTGNDRQQSYSVVKPYKELGMISSGKFAICKVLSREPRQPSPCISIEVQSASSGRPSLLSAILAGAIPGAC